MIKGDRSILGDFLLFFMNDAGKRLNLSDTGLIVSGIRLGNEALIFKDKLL